MLRQILLLIALILASYYVHEDIQEISLDKQESKEK